MSAELEAKLRAWVESELGVPVTELALIPGGASRRSYKVNRADAAPVFLRVDSGEGPLSGTQFTLAREWSFLKPISDRGYPAPGVIAFSAELNAILMEHVEGQTSYQASLPAPEQRAMERALIDCVVDLQRIPPDELGVSEYAGVGTVGEAVSSILAVWQQLYTDTVSFKDPAVDYALEWLKHNVPDANDPAVLVHGDVGPGNFLFRPNGEIAALIDWELVRVGHPLEDLACILCRALGVSFGAPEQLVADFAESSGKAVDRRALDYAVVLVIGEWCVGIHRALSRPNVQLDMAMLYIWGHANRYEMLRKLAGLAGREMPAEPALDESAFELDFLGTYIEESLSSVLLPAAKEVFVSHRVNRLLQLQKIQDSLLRYGRARYESEDIERAGALLGQRFGSHAEAIAALIARAPAAAREGDAAFLDFLLWRSARERVLLRRAMGEMAGRSIRY
jgi:aminoglycoside phosphotransferase (APT) family kinase protein